MKIHPKPRDLDRFVDIPCKLFMESIEPNLSESRNWAELPSDILTLIFEKVGQFELLLTAQAVCAPWRRVSYEPQLWRVIDMRNPWDYCEVYDLEKMATEALSRSCGQLVEFSVEYFPSDDILHYAADRSDLLRCLRLVSCYRISDDALVKVAKKIPLLEELEISYCSFSKEVLESVGQTCPCLKSLHLNCKGYPRPRIECDEEANAIAQNMPELRHLQLFGNKLSDCGLQAILDCCPNLVSLDLRQCFSLNFEGNLRKKCMDRIKYLRLPDDSTDDYGFDAEIGGYGSYDGSNDGSFDEEYPYAFYDMDLLSDDEYYEFSDGFEFPIGYDWDFI